MTSLPTACLDVSRSVSVIGLSSVFAFPNACPCAKDQTRAADGTPVQAKSPSSVSSSHSSICVGAIVLFGRCELSVPALTFGVSTNFALANFLASSSFGNVFVALTRFRFPRGSSNETYHVPLDLLAMIPSRGLRRRLTDRGRISIEG